MLVEILGAPTFREAGAPEMLFGSDGFEGEFAEVGDELVALNQHAATKFDARNGAAADMLSHGADGAPREGTGLVQIHELRRVAADALGAFWINRVELCFGAPDSFCNVGKFGSRLQCLAH